MLFDTIARQATFPSAAIARTTLASMQQQWQAKKISNYDYLMFLNECAGRSVGGAVSSAYTNRAIIDDKVCRNTQAHTLFYALIVA